VSENLDVKFQLLEADINKIRYIQK